MDLAPILLRSPEMEKPTEFPHSLGRMAHYYCTGSWLAGLAGQPVRQPFRLPTSFFSSSGIVGSLVTRLSAMANKSAWAWCNFRVDMAERSLPATIWNHTQ